MLTLKLNNYLRCIYSPKTANSITILVNILLLLIAILFFLPSINLFMKGSDLKIEQFLFFFVFVYCLLECYQLSKISSDSVSDSFQLVVNPILTTTRTYVNMKDTFIFTEKKFYNIKEQLKRFDVPIMPITEIDKEIDNKLEDSNIINSEDDELEDMMDNLSEQELEAMCNESNVLDKDNVILNPTDLIDVSDSETEKTKVLMTDEFVPKKFGINLSDIKNILD